MDLPAHATEKSFQIFAGISAAALLGLLIPLLYVTGGALPFPIERSAVSDKDSDSVPPIVAKPEQPQFLEAVCTIDVFDKERDPVFDLAVTVERATAENKRILLQTRCYRFEGLGRIEASPGRQSTG